MQVRTYGTSGNFVVVPHGGPGAPRYMAPVAQALADTYRVLEPMQRSSGGEPLTVARHVADLHRLVEERCEGIRPALVGHSWGAMLALAYSAAHPGRVTAIALIGCGTFDTTARDRLRSTREARTDDNLRRRLEQLSEEFPNINDQMRVRGKLMKQLDSCELISTDTEDEEVDARANQETWQDMLRQQEQGVYPAAFAAIHEPVIMLHGDYDSHPGSMIRASLEPHLPQLEYRELKRCGHYPWLEKAAHDEFIVVLREWLALQFTKGPSAGSMMSPAHVSQNGEGHKSS